MTTDQGEDTYADSFQGGGDGERYKAAHKASILYLKLRGRTITGP